METISPEQVKEISGYLETWDSVSFDDKHRVTDWMISAIQPQAHRMENLTAFTHRQTTLCKLCD